MIFLRFIRILVSLLGLTAFVWLVGLTAFVTHITSLTEPTIDNTTANTDAIVVLTGGSERITAGFELLNAGKAKQLFISGVHSGLTLDQLIGKTTVDKQLRGCCITLGHYANTTFGNAVETRDWVKAHDIHSLRLVTANYHMPRSLMVLQSAMPEMPITPHPVTPDNVKLNDWWEHPGTARLLVMEYSKFVYAALLLRFKQ